MTSRSFCAGLIAALLLAAPTGGQVLPDIQIDPSPPLVFHDDLLPHLVPSRPERFGDWPLLLQLESLGMAVDSSGFRVMAKAYPPEEEEADKDTQPDFVLLFLQQGNQYLIRGAQLSVPSWMYERLSELRLGNPDWAGRLRSLMTESAERYLDTSEAPDDTPAVRRLKRRINRLLRERPVQRCEAGLRNGVGSRLRDGVEAAMWLARPGGEVEADTGVSMHPFEFEFSQTDPRGAIARGFAINGTRQQLAGSVVMAMRDYCRSGSPGDLEALRQAQEALYKRRLPDAEFRPARAND